MSTQPAALSSIPLTISQAPYYAHTASPPLSALYRARVRLLLELPPERTKNWCCSTCGGLRDGYGWRMVRRGNNSKSAGQPKRGRKRKQDQTGATGDDDLTQTKPRQDQQGGKMVVVDDARTNQSSETSTSSNNKKAAELGNPPPQTHLRGKCGICGTSFRASAASNRARLASFPPARVAARQTRSMANKHVGEETAGPSSSSSSFGSVNASTNSQYKTCTATANPENNRGTKPHPPDLLRASPSLQHIPTSDPTPATSPLPKVSPSTLPPLTTPSSRSASPVGGLPKSSASTTGSKTASTTSATTGKRKKKSGLAKLLADSAARKEQDKDGFGALSKWGLN